MDRELTMNPREKQVSKTKHQQEWRAKRKDLPSSPPYIPSNGIKTLFFKKSMFFIKVLPMEQKFKETPERNQMTSSAWRNKTIPHVGRYRTGLTRVNRDYFQIPPFAYLHHNKSFIIKQYCVISNNIFKLNEQMNYC